MEIVRNQKYILKVEGSRTLIVDGNYLEKMQYEFHTTIDNKVYVSLFDESRNETYVVGEILAEVESIQLTENKVGLAVDAVVGG